MMSKTILVTGATGNLGKEVVKALKKGGFKVKAASTNPKRIKETERVRAVKLDYDDPSTLEPAVRGVNGLFLIAVPMDPNAPEKLKPVIDKAKCAGVTHIVFISGLGVEQNEKAPLRIVERYILESEINYTFLRPNFFMENFTVSTTAAMIKNKGAIYVAAADGKVSFVSARDVAEVAAVAFGEKHYGHAYGLSGPRALDHGEIAKIISHVCRKKVEYFDIAEDEMLERARQSGMPENMVRYMGALYSVVRAGYMAAISNDVEYVTGHRPIDFSNFAGENADKWQ
jgi:uncharacterized protein YbjT (DUF2867 family)